VKKNVRCIGCGLCSYTQNASLEYCDSSGSWNPNGKEIVAIDNLCPLLVDYRELYKDVYSCSIPNNQLGIYRKTYVANASDPGRRLSGASGGVITAVLGMLLDRGDIDAAIVAYQPQEGDFKRVGPIVVRSSGELEKFSGSVYITVPMLKALSDIDPSEKYGIVLVPEHAATLRQLQKQGDQKALAVKFIAGLMTGTTLKPGAIDLLLRRYKVPPDEITSFSWRYGIWPGKLRIMSRSGVVIEQDKVYYNFLIPSFIAPHSLSSHDFYNEFSDISVGDAWDDDLERRKEGVSLLLIRSKYAEGVIDSASASGLIQCIPVTREKAERMHQHMFEFKKRGSYIRTHMLGFDLPIYLHGYTISNIPKSRVRLEKIIRLIFRIAQSKTYIWLLGILPLSLIGYLFNQLRLGWKKSTVKVKRGNKVVIK
jgi:coenzyme F420-reducing hydrogenase beta subunit